MDATPDYADCSAVTWGLGIDLAALRSVPPLTDPALRGGHREGGSAIRTVIGTVAVADDEPLVDAGRDLLCINCYFGAGWAGTSPTTWLRLGVVHRLIELASGLPDGFGLAIFDGWRSPTTVRALYAHYYGPGSTLEPGFLADPDAEDLDATPPPPPPHGTGGAVDLTLSWRGTPLSLGTPFDEFTARAHLTALEEAPGGADESPDALDRDLRRLLHAVMTDAGFAAYDQEWWHFSYGDHAWAAATGAAVLYGTTAPNR